MRSYYKSRRWYQRYLEMYSQLIQQGVPVGCALIALRECHRMMNESKAYNHYFIAQSAEDSINHIEFDIHNPRNLKRREKKIIERGTRKIMICKATNLKVEMEYTGDFGDNGKTNGHRGWMCLHDPHDEYEL